MRLCDLEPGFHLVPTRDHCRSMSDPARPTAADRRALDSVIAWGDTPKSWTRAEANALREAWWDYSSGGRARNDAYDAFMARRLKERLAARAKRRAVLASRKRKCALIICDPMAVQASMILRDVLRELRGW